MEDEALGESLGVMMIDVDNPVEQLRLMGGKIADDYKDG